MTPYLLALGAVAYLIGCVTIIVGTIELDKKGKYPGWLIFSVAFAEFYFLLVVPLIWLVTHSPK